MLWWLADRSAAAPDARFVRRTTAGTVILRAVCSFAQHNIIGQYYRGTLGADTLFHYHNAVELAEAWRAGLWLPQLPTSLAQSHGLMIGLKTTVLVYLFGPSPMLGEAFTITLNASICIAVYLICRHIKCTPAATRAAVLLNALLPSFIFWSTQDLKDPVLATCGAWALLGMLKVSEHLGRLRWWILLAAVDLVGLLYRPYVGILLIAGQGMAWAYAVRLPRTAMGGMVRVGLFLVLAPLAIYFGVNEMQDTYGQGMDLQWANNQFNAFREGAVEGGIQGSEYEVALTASTPAKAILQLPIRILLLFLTPIPFVPGSLRRMLMWPEMLFIYFWVLPWFGRGVREAWVKNRNALMAILLAVGPVIAAYALKTSVSGEAARMRTQFLPELLIFAGIGYAVTQRQRTAVREAFQRRLRWTEHKQALSQDEAAS